MTEYLPPTDLKEGDLVWIRWESRVYQDMGIQAKPTVVIKVYDDGNILHRQDAYDEIEFAFAKDIYAKTVSNFSRMLRYRLLPITELQQSGSKDLLEAIEKVRRYGK